MIRIAVDAMGGDYAPREVVHGAVLAAREYGVAVHLVGPVDAVNAELKRHDIKGLTIEIVPCSEVVEMGEKAAKSVIKKKDSSIVVTTKLVHDGLADGMVAAGSTGAAGVAAQLGLGRIAHVERAAIAAMMPTTTKGKQVIVVDVGANVESNPHQLLQFGLMGSILAKGMQGIANPTVGLLNIGTEESKGNKLVQDTYKLLKAHKEINFIGFVEGRDFPLNKVDVVVTDGFTGNIALKTAEGIARMITTMLKQEIMSTVRTQMGGILVKPSFEEVRRRIDYNELGGALLVGVKGVCVIAHGSSKHTAIKNAIRVANTMAKAKIIQKFEEVLSLAPAGTTT
ncbi:MAG TPA: phosphate acyltransferase PlsX [Oculatellaceae cyanobacterium]